MSTMNDLFSLTRREFLKNGAMAMAGASMDRPHAKDVGADALDPATLAPFVDPLLVPRVMKAAGVRAHPEHAGQRIPFYRMAMR